MHTRKFLLLLLCQGAVGYYRGKYCGSVDQEKQCGGVFFRNADTSGDTDLSLSAKRSVNVTAVYPAANAGIVAVEYYDSTEHASVASRSQPETNTLRSRANAFDAGYVLNITRQTVNLQTSLTRIRDSDDTFNSYIGTSAFVCVSRSLVVLGQDNHFRCYQGSIPADSYEESKAAMAWCEVNLQNTAFVNIVASFCGGGGEGIFFAYVDDQGALKIKIYPYTDTDAESQAYKSIAQALAANPKAFKTAASNSKAIAIQVNQSLFLFGAAEFGGVTADNKRTLLNAVKPVASATAISCTTGARQVLFFGDVRNGIVPNTDWIVGEIVSASYSPCFLAFDMKSSAIVQWGTEDVCNNYASSDSDRVSIQDVHSLIKEPSALRVGADVFAAVGKNGVAASWGSRASGAAGLLHFRESSLSEPLIAVTKHAVCYTQRDGLTVSLGQKSTGGNPSAKDVQSAFYQSMAQISGFENVFIGILTDGSMVTWPGDFGGHYRAQADRTKMKYDFEFKDPVASSTQLSAVLIVPCGYSAWTSDETCEDTQRSTITQTRGIEVSPINAVCELPLVRIVPCHKTTDAPATKASTSGSGWSPKYIALIVCGVLLIAGLAWLARVMWRGRAQNTEEEEGLD